MRLLSAILTLFLIMDPIGNMPVFASYLKDVDQRRKTWVVGRESLFALVILLTFLFLATADELLTFARNRCISRAGCSCC